MAVKWKWKPAAGGGSIPSNLEQKVNQNETKINTIEQNYSTKQYVNDKIQKRILSITNTQGNTYIIRPTAGYEIISVMVGRKRTAEGYYFFNYQSGLNFQLFMDSNGAYKLYTEGPVSGFNGDYKIIVVEMKV